MKEQFVNLLHQIKRPGLNDLTEFLEHSDFYKAPCSTKYHLSIPGGLVQHSINVYHILVEKDKQYDLNTDPNTLLICGLLHDVCKIGFYEIDDEAASDKQITYISGLCRPNYQTFSPEIKEQWEKEVKGKNLTKGQASKLIEWLKNGSYQSFPELPFTYKINDQFPIGHGEKSVIILQKFIDLTVPERLAIRWHMGPFGAGFDAYAYNAAKDMTELVPLLFTADFEASSIVEKIKD